MITKNDLLKIEVQYSTMQLKKIETENALTLAKAMFNKIIGNENTKDYNIAEQEIYTENAKLDFNELL